MTFEELIIKLQIQEDNKKALPRGKQLAEAKANLAEAKGNPSKKRKFQKDGKTQAAEKFKGNCHHCGKPGHMIKDCRKLKTEQQVKAKAKGKAHDIIEEFSAVVLEANLVENPMQWWMDTGATRHICSNRDAFSTYTPILR
ncbi:hypothetical protein RND71_007616 [Anisodus tanguticus]|uniref:CCHC-type domain-containing protein n=1 Tax=Anisodus tanguticus TaxID=243964 RepID=A0AAE1VKA0_9SOLA|nr:hypothetical protein RND71_007616 [Anisodus tanguticus]